MNRFSKQELAILKKAKQFTKSKFENHVSKVGGHGLDHAMRVTGVAAYLSSKESKNPFLPVLAAILHDVGRASDDPRSQNFLHGKLSRELTEHFLSTLKLIKEDKILVENAIEDHPFLNEKVRESYVVKILMDADRIDSLGAMSPIKAASYKWNLPLYTGESSSVEDGEIDSVYGYFGVRILEWGNMMWTKTGKKMAAKRLKFLKKFNEEFVSEITFMNKCFNELNL